MSLEKINYDSAEVKLCRHSEQPDVPKRSAEETKGFFDSMARDIIIPKINEAIDAVNEKADSEKTYTKEEADNLLEGKANADSVYSKTESDTLLGNKADSEKTYTKEEVDNLLEDKADADSVYSKAESDALLVKKVDSDEVYTKNEVDKMISSSGSSSGGGAVELSEFVDLYEVCYGSLTNMLGRRVVAFTFHNNEYGTEITLRKVTDGIEEFISVSVRYDYVVFAYYMGDEITTINFKPDEVINLYNIFDIVPLRHKYPDDGIYIEATDMDVYGRVLFDGLVNASTAATLFRSKPVEVPEIPEIVYAEKKVVEVGDDITHLCGNSSCPGVNITVKVTLECGAEYEDTIRYYESDDNREWYVVSGYWSNYISSNDSETTLNSSGKIDLCSHYGAVHQDSMGGTCESAVKSIIVTNVEYTGGIENYVVTKGVLTYRNYSRIIQ